MFKSSEKSFCDDFNNKDVKSVIYRKQIFISIKIIKYIVHAKNVSKKVKSEYCNREFNKTYLSKHIKNIHWNNNFINNISKSDADENIL